MTFSRNNTQLSNIECHYTDVILILIILMSRVLIVMLSVVMLNVVMLSVAAPLCLNQWSKSMFSSDKFLSYEACRQRHKTFFPSSLTLRQSKLQRLTLALIFSLI